MSRRWLDVLEKTLSLPTVPFEEGAVIRHIERWARRRKLEVRRDKAGNLSVRLQRGARSTVGWTFTAHMDHPGFVLRRRRGLTGWAEFRGGIKREYFHQAAIRFHASGETIRGIVEAVRREPRYGFLSCRVRLDGPVVPGSIGVWDVPECERNGRTVASQACDDLAGVAAILCALDRLRTTGDQIDVTALFTRAEEAGFVGAVEACRLRNPAVKNRRIVAIEASRNAPGAMLGDGVVIRVGDRTSAFEGSLGNLVHREANRLKRRDRRFSFVRQLMDGGTCEASVFAAFGHQATGLCIPLGNYHNQGAENKVAAEQINIDDWLSLVKLLVTCGRCAVTTAVANSELATRLSQRHKGRMNLLKEGI